MDEFDLWNGLKRQIDAQNRLLEFKERDIFLLRVGKNVGHEQNGKGRDFLRPVFVFKKFGPHVFWGIPLSSTHKRGRFYHYLPERKDSALLTQLKLLDARRMMVKIGLIGIDDYSIIKKKVIGLIVDDFLDLRP